ncbi:MAG: YggS family pyridoxal phosphate-dependent enzyme [Acidimicrobiia bacterium]
MSVVANLARVRERIEAAAQRAGRDPATVLLVGASKTVPATVIAETLAGGLVDFGENRAQELVAKAAELEGSVPAPRWHFLGRLQRNKVAALAPRVTLWHSVDRAELGATIARRAPGARVLVEVNLAREDQKGGCDPDSARALVDALRALDLQVTGLMTVPPAGSDPRPLFVELRALAGRLEVHELSMGMSDDFEIAVEEGATIVRVGRALFGARPLTA